MFSAPLMLPRAMSGTQISASGSIGVPGTMRTRGSRCAWFESTALRFRAAQPVMPSEKLIVVLMISSAYTSRTSTGLRIRLVGFVDRQRVVRDQVADVVGDPDEQRVEALLGEHFVENVGEPPVRLDESGIPRLGAGVEKPKMARTGYHRSPDRSELRHSI